MEQTLLPGRVSCSNYFSRNNSDDRLTFDDFRVMYGITNKKEAQNANRKQEPDPGNDTDSPVPQRSPFCRSNSNRERETDVSFAGRKRVQESFRSRNGHHRACLRRLDFLECGENHTCNRRGRREHQRDCQGRSEPGGCSTIRQNNDSKESDHLQSPQPEGRLGGKDTLVLQGMRRELPRGHRRAPQDLSGRTSIQLGKLDDRLILNRQAPLTGSLPDYISLETTMASTSRGGQR